MKARSNENTKPPESQGHSRGSQEGAAAAQTETQIQSESGSPRDGDLSKYANLASELTGQLQTLGALHEQRGSFQERAESLKSEQAGLEQKVLDGDHQAIADLVLNHDAVTLNDVKLSALAVRIGRLETELHSRVPLCIETFGRLRQFVVRETLEACRTAVAKLIAPDMSVAPEHLDAVAIAMPDYVKVSRLTLPGLSWAFTRPLEAETPHWSSLVRPYTEAEKRAQRLETVESLKSATKQLCEAARRLIERASEFPERVPAFKCEPEVIEPAVVDAKFLEWQQPLGGSDEEWCREICRIGGKPFPPVDPLQVEVLNRMLEQRHAMPQSHGLVLGPMIGTTTDGRSWEPA